MAVPMSPGKQPDGCPGIDLPVTPVRSPQSNAISAAFGKTPKRDYAPTALLPNADTNLALPQWIADHGEIHPHSGLNTAHQASSRAQCLTRRRPSDQTGSTPRLKQVVAP